MKDGGMNNMDIASIHAMIDDATKYLWFNQEVDDVAALTDNEKLSIFMKDELQLDHTKATGEANKGVLYDPVISHYLNADVYYITPAKKRQLISLVSEQCVKGFSKDLAVLMMKTEKGVFIFTSYEKNTDARYQYPHSQCSEAQKVFNDSIKQNPDFDWTTISSLERFLYADYRDRFGVSNLINPNW